MSLFDSIFGRTDKINFSELFPDPPQLTLAPGSVNLFQGGIQSLIDTFTRRSQGQDQFDFIKFVFEPQLRRLNQAFGIDSRGRGELGPLGRRQGALGRLEADLQRRGLFDTGSSGVLAAQLEAERAAKEADLFGEAKTLQRADIDASLANLNQLFPQRFQVQNIPNQVDFFNAQNRFNQATRRNIATANQRLTRPTGAGSVINPLLNLFLGTDLAGTGTGGGIANLFAGQSSGASRSRRTPQLVSPGQFNFPSNPNLNPTGVADPQNVTFANDPRPPSQRRFDNSFGLFNLFN